MAARRLDFFAVFVFTALAAFVLRATVRLELFTPKVLNHAPGICTVFDVDGAEDVEVLPNGIGFFTSGLRYYVGGLPIDPRIEARKGRIYTFNMNHSDKAPVEMSLYGFNVTGFNPHGLSLYTDPRTGVVSIFVVNHRPDAQAIEIFDFDQEAVSLVFRRSVWHELIYSPNDVAATGPDSFYVTNDDYHHFDQQFLRMLDMALLGYFLRSGVVYYDGSTSRATHVIGGLQEPNGIAIRDERLVFVNTHEKVKIYRRQKDNELLFAQEIDIGYRLDNVNVDKLTGDLWFSVFPRVLDFLTFSTNLDHQCPSKVVSVKLGEEHAEGDPFPFYDIREVYANNGSEVRGSTSATRHDGKFAVAAIFDKFLICDLGPY